MPHIVEDLRAKQSALQAHTPSSPLPLHSPAIHSRSRGATVSPAQPHTFRTPEPYKVATDSSPIHDFGFLHVWAGSPGLIRALCATPQRCASLKSILLPTYLQKVLGARERIPQESLQAYSPLLAALTEGELTDTVLPTAIRMMKRLPEHVLPSVAALLAAVEVDLSAHAVPLMGDVLPQMRHAKEPIRCHNNLLHDLTHTFLKCALGNDGNLMFLSSHVSYQISDVNFSTNCSKVRRCSSYTSKRERGVTCSIIET